MALELVSDNRLFRPNSRLRLDTYGSPPTPRELDVLVAVVRYSSLQATADHLGIKRYTVKNLLGRLYRRLGVDNRTQAVVLLWPVMADRFELP